MVQDWSRSLALRAATSGTGRSVRQIERRIKAWAGQSYRDLQANARTERVFSTSIANRGQGKQALAQLAIYSEFADK
jgi:hypothetical protein